MFPVSTKQGGMCMATPDVCKVPAPPAPPIPTPFPNIAQLNQAVGTTLQVKVMNQPVVTKNSQVPMSSGDEAGSIGGMISSMIKGPATFKKASMKVKTEGAPVVFPTCISGQNGTNANAPAGQIAAPSQTKVMVTM